MKGSSIQRGLDMQKGMAAFWLRQVAAVIAYAATVTLVRELSISHWLIIGGLHLTALLLVPYRYWAAMAIGESLSLSLLSVACVGDFGLTWALLNAVPSLLFTMPVVYLCRERWNVFPDRASVNMGVLLTCALIVSALRTAYSLGLISTTKLPAGYPLNYAFLTGRWMLGNYMGILTVVPILLVLRKAVAEHSWRGLGAQFLKSRLATESVFLLVPALAFLIGLGLNASPTANTRQLAQIAMFMPVLWLTLRYGWQGAAVGGTLSSLAVILLMPQKLDPDTLNAQVFIAFTISTMLIMGARIGSLSHQSQQERTDLRLALALAQRNMHHGELQLRMTSQALEQVRETVHSVYNVMLGRLRNVTPVFDDRSYRRQALVAQDQLYRLADSLCPVTWRERGLHGVLREGPLARVLDETGVSYWCDLRGPVSVLSPTIHLAIYRLVCEAAADGCARRDVTNIRVQVRCGRRGGRRWSVVRINLRSQPQQLDAIRWEELLPRVLRTATGLGWPAIEDRAATFEGRAREHLISSGRCISVLLFDPEQPDGDRQG